jgi:Tfp pilus assembly protein PilV
MMSITQKNEKGFCMLEIIIGLFILTLALMTFSHFAQTSFMMRQNARINDLAYSVAEQKLSTLRAEAFPAPTGSDTTMMDKISFIRKWSIDDTGHTQKAVIKVSWNSYKGTPHHIQFSGGVN